MTHYHSKTRHKPTDKWLVLRFKRSKDWLLSWAYRGYSFERLNPDE